MEALVPQNPTLLLVCVMLALAAGYFFGTRYARRQKRLMLKELNQTSLDMLDVKSDHAKLSKFLGQSQRKDRLLKLALKQLKDANTRADMLQTRVNRIEKQHYIKTSRLRLHATQASEKARRAAAIAARAASHLKRMEENQPSTQTINAPPPKSYGQGAAVPVAVVDQHSPEVQREAITRVSNRDSARFTQLRPSNEGLCFNSANLQAIEGIDPSVEKQLNQAGIHSVEQLAFMSDSDLAELSATLGDTADDTTQQQNYTAAWKGGAQRLLSKS